MRQVLLCCLVLATGCARRPAPPGPADAAWQPPARLSAYGLFRGAPADQEPAAGVLPYDLNTPLFSDYAVKYRFVRSP